MASSTVVRNREPLELGRNGVVGSVPRRPAAAKAPKMAMKPVIRNSHRGSWFVPLELARDGVVGSVPRRPAAAKAPKTAMKPVIRNSHRGSWLVPLELARDVCSGLCGQEGPLLLRLLIATRRFVLCRELLKDAIYMATKAVDKYSRRGYKERRQDGLCCPIDIIDIFDLL